MDRRFSAAGVAAKSILVAAALALTACSTGGPASDAPAAPSSAETPEEELSLRSAAMQRTVLEGALIGAGLGAAANKAYARPIPFGVVVGGTVGASYGSYLAFLQARYANNEARLEAVRSDIEATNAETAAAIATMQVVLDRQGADLAALRASAPASPELAAAVTQAETSLNDMRVAIDGAEGRREEFTVTKAGLEEGAGTPAIDGQIADLSLRIAEMREIAGTLATEI